MGGDGGRDGGYIQVLRSVVGRKGVYTRRAPRVGVRDNRSRRARWWMVLAAVCELLAFRVEGLLLCTRGQRHLITPI